MKAFIISSVMLTLLTLAGGNPVSAHGIRYSTNSGGIVVNAFFDGGRPAADLFVSVFAPGLKDRFQTGKTDKKGRFAIFPDRPGTWEILVYDRMGHRLEIKLPVDDVLRLKKSSETDGLYRYQKIFMGIAIIAVFFFGLWSLKKRKNTISLSESK